MSIDIQALDKKLKAVSEKEIKLKKERADLQKQKRKVAKDQKDFAYGKIGEIFFEKYKKDHGADFSASKNALLTEIEESKLTDKDKIKMSDLIENGALNFERPKLKKEDDKQEHNNSNLHYQTDR